MNQKPLVPVAVDDQVNDLADLSPEMKALFDQAARNLGFKDISELADSRAVVIPMNERWLHEPAMKAKLSGADDWMQQNPPASTDLAALEKCFRS